MYKMYKIKHIHLVEGCPAKQSPWGPSPSREVYKPHTSAHPMFYYLISEFVFYNFKTETNVEDNKIGAHFDNINNVFSDELYAAKNK